MKKYLSVFLKVIFISISQADKASDTLYYVFDSVDVYSTTQKHSSPLSLHVIKSDDLAVDKNKQTINKSLYYTELTWIKKICEKNFCNPEIIKHNLLKDDITVILKK